MGGGLEEIFKEGLHALGGHHQTQHEQLEKQRKQEEKWRRKEEKRRCREARGGRRGSHSSSSSSSSSSDDERKHHKQRGYGQQGYGQQGFGTSGFASLPGLPGFPVVPNQPGLDRGLEGYHQQPPLMPQFAPPPGPPPNYQQHHGDFQHNGSTAFSIALTEHSPIPPEHITGHAPFTDYGGEPVYLGLAAYHGGLHPCKIVRGFHPPCLVGFGFAEHAHTGPYFLVPFDPARMEWVHASGGHIPPGRRPVEGGREDNGAPLYHACAVVSGVRVPGKAAAHLGGASVPFGGKEHMIQHYELLCWR